ncbi:multidrug efflux MFS transporter, partial [Burkholderia sp. Cy-647]|uniref:MFS transporter n=1 Tax=Burkholderia sp. Cy-647 TaxID=2608328 RepID=UPI00141EDB1A
LAIVALAALTYAVIAAGRAGWGSAQVPGSFALALLAALAFVTVERRHPQPLLPMTLFRIPVVNVSALTGLSLNFGYYGLMFAMSLYFQNVRHDTPLQAGLAFLPMTALVAAANIVSGSLTARFGYRLPMLAGQLLAAAGYLALMLLHRDSSTLAVSLPLLAVGVGVALAVPSINTALLAHVEPATIGIASGLLNTARQVGGVLGVGLFGALAGTASRDMVGGLHAAVAMAAAASLASVALGLFGLKAAARPAVCTESA